jgi:hypothetical protein
VSTRLASSVGGALKDGDVELASTIALP